MNPTDWLVTPDLGEPSKWTHPIRHADIAKMEGMADMGWHRTHDEARLAEIVDGRPVAVMLHGGSIAEFERRVEEFRGANLCYLSMNRFEVMERRILSKIDRALDIVFLMSEQEMPRRIHDTNAWLDKGGQMLMTTFSALSWLEAPEWTHVVKSHDKQLYVMPRLLCRPTYPISLALILDELVRCGIERVVLLGCDGGVAKNPWEQKAMLASYYDPDFFVKEKRPTGLAFGTKHFNDTYVYNPDAISVMNCSPNSHIEAFPKINYDELLRMLPWK